MRGLKGRRVVLAGGASGIGAATVARFLEEECRVIVVDRDPRGAKQIKNKFASLIDAIVADVVDERAVAAAFSQVDSALGGVDVLINNAGISIRHRFLDLSVADWTQVLAVNLTGAFTAPFSPFRAGKEPPTPTGRGAVTAGGKPAGGLASR